MLLNQKSTFGTSSYRPSASLIMAVKDESKDCYDYRVLLFKRTPHTAYAPNHCVFPGGVFEPVADECYAWLQHYQDMGFTQAQLEELYVHANNRPHPLLTNGQHFARDISLRITAIRETFEEVGVFLCRDKDSLLKQTGRTLSGSIAHFREDFDRTKWQLRVHEDAMQFLELCRYLQVVPDVWSLHEWSVWRSPTTARKKYDTVFYFAAIEQPPNLILERSEVEIELLRSPRWLLSKFTERCIWLPPIQFYELSRLSHAHSWEQLYEFAHKRNSQGSTLLMPVYYRCKEGLIGTLPGDDFYPQDPEMLTETVEVISSIQEFRQRAKRLHRVVIRDMHDMTVELNIVPIDSHLSPCNEEPIGSKL